MIDLKINCPLCGSEAPKKCFAVRRSFYECPQCHLVFVEKSEHLSQHDLKKRYLLHENSIEQPGYCAFLNRAILAAKPFLGDGAKGLDFGCGPTPTLSQLAELEGIQMSNYDPLFFDAPLDPPYDVIFATECFEHFEEPAKDITRVVEGLHPRGILAVMTELWDEKADFKNWYYAMDPSHIVFYSRLTLEFICRQFKLKQVAGDGKRVFIFSKL